MDRSRAAVVLYFILVGAAMGIFAESPSVSAQTIPPLPTPATLVDTACRGCHGEKTDVLTLPSGETLPLGVDLAALDASPHSSRNEMSIPCSSCHVNDTRYRYPHPETTAQTLHEFTVAVTENCESCHYPHTPFHDTEQTDYTPPTCADCHGSHDIASVEDMAETMPEKCVACHTDQSRDWVEEFLTPRPGFGTGADGYAGSLRCAGCHEEKYFTWRNTRHARIIQDPSYDPWGRCRKFQR